MMEGRNYQENFEDMPCTLAQNTSPELIPILEEISLTLRKLSEPASCTYAYSTSMQSSARFPPPGSIADYVIVNLEQF